MDGLRTFQQNVSIIQRDAVWWMHLTVPKMLRCCCNLVYQFLVSHTCIKLSVIPMDLGYVTSMYMSIHKIVYWCISTCICVVL